MKCKYIITISVIIIVLIIVCYFAVDIVVRTSFSDESNIAEAIQIVVIFVAIFASFIALIIALSVSDPKPKQIKSKISVKKVDEIRPYDKNDMSEKLKKYFKAYPNDISSYQVHFEITNISGFDLKKPTITIRVPSERKCPNKNNRSSKYTKRILTSDLFSSSQDLKRLEGGDNTILSNSILPFLNDGDVLPFWVRMIINDEFTEKFSVKVSLNSENAEGLTEEVAINPEELIRNFKQNAPFANKNI